MNRIKLFCLPYAGGSAMVYKKWEEYLDKSISLCLLELAGRGTRHREPYYDSMQEATEDILSLVEVDLDKGEYAIFGHSMGSILAYELAAKMKERNLKQPIHIFFSGRYPPSIRKEGRSTHLLSQTEFTQEAIRMGGVPEKMLRFKALLNTAMDTLRADYKLLETRKYNPLIQRLDCNISVLSGKEDILSAPADMAAWKEYTKKQCEFYLFEGGHFYLHQNVEPIVKVINSTLADGEYAYFG